MFFLWRLLDLLIVIYIWIVIVQAVLSWLAVPGIVNAHHPLVRRIDEFCRRLTEPALRPIRRVLPPMGGIDLSPAVLLLLLFILRNYLLPWLFL
jgi:YggT family protein